MDMEYDSIIARLIDDSGDYLLYEFSYDYPYFNDSTTKTIQVSKDFISNNVINTYSSFAVQNSIK